jgi:hypothetical protein
MDIFLLRDSGADNENCMLIFSPTKIQEFWLPPHIILAMAHSKLHHDSFYSYFQHMALTLNMFCFYICFASYKIEDRYRNIYERVVDFASERNLCLNSAISIMCF